MKKKLLQQLVLISYKQNQLDHNQVDKISSLLSMQDLKAYIRALKLMEQKKKVYVALPSANLYNTAKKDLTSVFPNKDLVFEEDPSLLLGMQLKDDDMVYELSLRDRLDQVLEQVDQLYEQ